MKPIWKGDLAFGLVTIRTQLFAATQQHSLGFKLLCAKCHTPISYERVCPRCKKVIPYDQVVKGLKLSDGSYFIITPEKLKTLRPEKTDTIDIKEFVDRSAIKYIYLNAHYFLAPQKASEKSFYLLKKALEETDKVAIGQFVMRDKQYVCIINPYEEVLLLTTLFYEYELRSTAGLPAPKKETITKKEIDLAKQLIKQLSKKSFNLGIFKDEFAHNLKLAIKKGKKEKIPEKGTVTKRPSAKPIEPGLLEHLRASIKSPSRHRTIARASSRRATKKKSLHT